MTTTPPFFEHVPVESIKRDEEVNTSPLSTRKVEQWAEKGFDPAAFGVLLLSERKDGTYVVLDGQHRIKLVELTNGFGDSLVPAMVYKDLTRAEEARIYRVYNFERTTKAPEDAHRARLTEEDPVAWFIHDTLVAYGWEPEKLERGGSVRAVRALYRLYELDRTPRKTNFVFILSSLATAFPGEPTALQASIVDGVGALVMRNLDKIAMRPKRLATVLRSFETPAKLRARGRTKKEELFSVGVRSDADGMGVAIRETYNYKLQWNTRLDMGPGN